VRQLVVIEFLTVDGVMQAPAIGELGRRRRPRRLVDRILRRPDERDHGRANGPAIRSLLGRKTWGLRRALVEHGPAGRRRVQQRLTRRVADLDRVDWQNSI
jgi:hypothetical protein